MDIGQDRDRVGGTDLRQDGQGLIIANTRKRSGRGPVGLAVRGFEDIRNAPFAAELEGCLGHFHAKVFGFDYTGTGNQKQRLRRHGLQQVIQVHGLELKAPRIPQNAFHRNIKTPQTASLIMPLEILL